MKDATLIIIDNRPTERHETRFRFQYVEDSIEVTADEEATHLRFTVFDKYNTFYSEKVASENAQLCFNLFNTYTLRFEVDGKVYAEFPVRELTVTIEEAGPDDSCDVYEILISTSTIDRIPPGIMVPNTDDLTLEGGDWVQQSWSNNKNKGYEGIFASLYGMELPPLTEESGLPVGALALLAPGYDANKLSWRRMSFNVLPLFFSLFLNAEFSVESKVFIAQVSKTDEPRNKERVVGLAYVK